MKWIIAFCFCCLGFCSFAQADDTSIPPYKRFPTLPPIQLLLSDSTTMFTKEDFAKKKPVLLILFSPECSHCQHETEELVKYKDDLKDIQIVMATLHPLTDMKAFIEHYKLKDLPNVIVGKDIYYLMPSFYNIHNLPYMAMYNKKGELIGGYEGSLSISKVLDIFAKQ